MKAFETVRTDRLAFLADESIPTYLKPQHCNLHRVSWYVDENDATLDEHIHGSKCPVCIGKMSMVLLMALEELKIEGIRNRLKGIEDIR